MCLYWICSVSDIILYFIALVFPPVAVLLRSGVCSSDFLLNMLLTLLGFLPGVIHAFYYITITSPLRRSLDYGWYYEQHWNVAHPYYRQPQPTEVIMQHISSVSTPLLYPNKVTQSQPMPPTIKRKLQDLPPPYTETL